MLCPYYYTTGIATVVVQYIYYIYTLSHDCVLYHHRSVQYILYMIYDGITTVACTVLYKEHTALCTHHILYCTQYDMIIQYTAVYTCQYMHYFIYCTLLSLYARGRTTGIQTGLSFFLTDEKPEAKYILYMQNQNGMQEKYLCQYVV